MHFSLISAWVTFVNKTSLLWRDFHSYWIHGFPGDLLVVQYESLKDNLDYNLKRMTDFLNVTVTEQILDCTVNASHGLHQRAHTGHEDHKDKFTPTMVHIINEAISYVQNMVDS